MWADDVSKVDMLAYGPYADLVYEIAISERLNPLTIGLFGNWGSGKSTLLNLINQKIKGDPHQNVVSVTVNAWMFEGYDDAKTALMESILRNLEDNKTIFEKCGEKIKGLLKRVDWIRVGGTLAKKGIPLALSVLSGNPFPMLFGGFSTKDFDSEEKIQQKIQDLSTLKKEYIKEQEDKNVIENIRKFREDFVNLIKESNIKNLIIMIDDLDRCNPDRIIETLEAIKLFLSVEKTTFIIAMDEDVITYSIKRKYPQLEDVDLDLSKDYIEKIVQLPIRVSELAENDVKNYMLLLVCEMYLKDEMLNRLIDVLKERGIFVKGEIITAKDIQEILSTFSTNDAELFKTGSNKVDFEEQLNVFNSIANIIAITLKGNPRQAKRFLNTFYMRKRLAELQRIELNLAVLAKLMVLEYVNKDLFRELYKWQLEHNGIPKPLKDIEQSILKHEIEKGEGSEEKHKEWHAETIKRWIGVEPSNLSDYDLSQYFYLARDSVRDKSISATNLSQKERTIINQICNTTASEIVRRKKIEELKGYDEVTRNEIVKGLISKYNQDPKTHLWVLVELYKLYPQYQDRIFDEFKKLKTKDVTPAEIILFSGLTNDAFEKLKTYYVEEKKVSKALWDTISYRR
jgi:hypothetical protein